MNLKLATLLFVVAFFVDYGDSLRMVAGYRRCCRCAPSSAYRTLLLKYTKLSAYAKNMGRTVASYGKQMQARGDFDSNTDEKNLDEVAWKNLEDFPELDGGDSHGVDDVSDELTKEQTNLESAGAGNLDESSRIF